MSIALTAVAAIGGFAFSTNEGTGDRLEILLILPILLSGLGLAYLSRSHSCHLIGEYISDKLWPALIGGETTGANSWEKFIQDKRALRVALVSPHGYLSFVPGFLIFGAPSFAALYLNRDQAPDWVPWKTLEGGGALTSAWTIGAGVLIASFLLALSVGVVLTLRSWFRGKTAKPSNADVVATPAQDAHADS